MHNFVPEFPLSSRSLSEISNLTCDSDLIKPLEEFSRKKTSDTTPDIILVPRVNFVSNIESMFVKR